MSLLVITFCAYTLLSAPLLALLALGVSALADYTLSERVTTRIVGVATAAGFFALLIILAILGYTGNARCAVSVGHWVDIPGYHFAVKLLFDPLSITFGMLAYVICYTVGVFAARYLHREPGYHRFHLLYLTFVLGMTLASMAGTIQTLFVGWELVGLSSAILVAFFHERSAPVRNGLRVWSVYRVSDAALLIAAILLHHLRGEGDFDLILGAAAWPAGQVDLDPDHAFIVGLLLLLAAAGKSALGPFSGWLPRAMEGPTPSSAVFYGALSVHLGAYLLLRVGPLIALSGALQAVVILLGLSTAIGAALTARVQTDIKSVLSYASLTQVGIIFTEIGLGFHIVALFHIVGHACFRTLQFLRAPSLLQDYKQLENAIGQRLPSSNRFLGPKRLRIWIYRLALERGYWDGLLDNCVVGPFLRLFRWCDTLERAWTARLGGAEPIPTTFVKCTGKPEDRS